jgi:hypothetical protein
MDFMGPPNASTVFDADGFYIWITPNGMYHDDDPDNNKTDEPVIMVTYKLKRANFEDGGTWIDGNSAIVDYTAYDANAGYEVYHAYNATW